MAEGIQITTPNLIKYFCHHCSREVSPFHTVELICPDCSGGFLEEVSKDLYEAENMCPSYDEDGYLCDDEDDTEDLAFLPEISMDRLISQMLMNVAGANRPSEAEESPPEDMPQESLSRSDSLNDIIRHVRYQGFLEEGLIMNDDSDSPFQYLADMNVVDEVDALASQLLDEVELSGPPPLSKEQIKALSTVALSQDHIENGVQCTVCMDDFGVREKAKCLPCGHLYHEKCITPWLEKQATCPNCRDVIEIQVKSKRSKSCPRSRLNSRSSDSRRFSESPATSISNFFTSSRNPFRFLN